MNSVVRMKVILLLIAASFSFVSVLRSEAEHLFQNDAVSLAVEVPPGPPPLMVPLTLIQGAASKGAGEIISFAFVILS